MFNSDLCPILCDRGLGQQLSGQQEMRVVVNICEMINEVTDKREICQALRAKPFWIVS